MTGNGELENEESQYDESSDFSLSLKNADLRPKGFPERRTGNPFSRPIKSDTE